MEQDSVLGLECWDVQMDKTGKIGLLGGGHLLRGFCNVELMAE